MPGRQRTVLAPCSNATAQKHLVDTILEGVNLADIEKYLKDQDKIARATVKLTGPGGE